MLLLEDSIKTVIGNLVSCLKNEMEFFHKQSSLPDSWNVVEKSYSEQYVRSVANRI